MSVRESKAVKSRIDRAVCHNTTAHASPLLSSIDQPFTSTALECGVSKIAET